jgi:hypothetical protein
VHTAEYVEHDVSDDGLMLLSMDFERAKRMRRAYGDAKYGCMRGDVSMLAQGYMEAIDISNYYDIARELGEIDEETWAELQNLLLTGVLAPLRRIIPRELP